ncbi:MAG: branched-chain amino acid transport system substrate-binding protein, partial [Actinomycetota bacterium]|nr:branched-chain amino acid transport system substrate-binding protein [Actinomycetota bacterium]
CSDAHDAAPKQAAKYGLTLVYRGRASIAQPDYTSNCQAARSAGAELLDIGLDGNSVERVARSCNSVGYHPIYAVGTLSLTPQMSSNPLLDGMGNGSTVAPWMVTSNPAVAEFRSTLQRYAPSAYVGASAGVGWVAAKLFELAAKGLTASSPTSENLLDGLWSIKGNDLGGLTLPLTFTKGQNAPFVVCYWAVQLKRGEYTSPNQGQRICP